MLVAMLLHKSCSTALQSSRLRRSLRFLATVHNNKLGRLYACRKLKREVNLILFPFRHRGDPVRCGSFTAR